MAGYTWPEAYNLLLMEQFKYLFKVILIGDSHVGKSSIMLRFTNNRFKSGDYEPTSGVVFGSKMV